MTCVWGALVDATFVERECEVHDKLIVAVEPIGASPPLTELPYPRYVQKA